jgi:hypothetical protein
LWNNDKKNVCIFNIVAVFKNIFDVWLVEPVNVKQMWRVMFAGGTASLYESMWHSTRPTSIFLCQTALN